MATEQTAEKTDRELSLELQMIFGPRLLANLLEAGRELVRCDNGKFEVRRRNDKWEVKVLVSRHIGN